MLKTTDETLLSNLPERDKERDYELKQWIEMATHFAQREEIELHDTDE